jgi:hypothetical protein
MGRQTEHSNRLPSCCWVLADTVRPYTCRIDRLSLLVEVAGLTTIRKADHSFRIYLDNLTVPLSVAVMLLSLTNLVSAVLTYHYCSAILTEALGAVSSSSSMT